MVSLAPAATPAHDRSDNSCEDDSLASLKDAGRSADSRRMVEKRSGLGLFAFYVVATLVPILALGVVLARTYREDLDEQGLHDAGEISSIVAEATVSPELSGDTLTNGLTAEERAGLVKSLEPILREGTALRLRLRDRVGHVVFDPERPNAAPFGPRNNEVVEALTGKDVRLRTHLNTDAADHARTAGTAAVEVYEPVRASTGSHFVGVMEIYVPYGPIARSIDQAYRSMTTLLAIGLLVLWALSGAITWSVTRKLRRSNAENRFLAKRDPLTRMANRFAIVEDVDANLRRLGVDHGMTVAILDIDGFTEINEVLGHANGDEFLRHVARIVQASAGRTGFTARIGADQFAIARATCSNPTMASVIRGIRNALLDELELDGVTLTAEFTVGFVDGDATVGASELLRRAGVACRAAKQVNAPVLSYEPSQEGFDADRLTLVAELRHAIDDGQLVLHYQPKVNAADGAVTSVEALVRWQHPTRGLLAPDVFVPAAESTELIIGLTDWVVDRACAQAAAWVALGMPLPIAVNVSARCLRDHEFADRMFATLRRHELSTDLIAIEITETAVIADPERAAATLRRLAERGMGVAIDDFGVGYTSLAHLDRLPITELKIDREFVSRMALGAGAGGDAVVRAVVSLGHGLGMTVVAEGVEDDATLSLLAEIGCDVAQGYAIARPAPAEVFEAWLHTRRAPAESAVSSPA